MTKLCRDCRHYEPPASYIPFVGALPSGDAIKRAQMHKCYGLPKHRQGDPVIGGPRSQATDCYVERDEAGECGPDARWFEPKETE